MPGFDNKELFIKYRYPILILLIGLILVGGGFFFFKSGIANSGTKVEILGESTNIDTTQNVTTEIAGEVITPGVYKLPNGSRIDDLLVVSGGLSGKADRSWTDKYLNRASKLTDGQKVYIPSINQQSNNSTASKTTGDQNISTANLTDSSKLVNINTGSLQELDTLPGIGQVYGQKIIEQRPYSTVEELVSKGVIKQSLYDKIKNLISIY